MAGKQHRKYICSHCTKSFGKAEHLSRHARTHTGSKPFRCGVCDQSFSRQDSLSRHQKRHDSETHAIDGSSLNGEKANPDEQPDHLDFNTATTQQYLDRNPATGDNLGGDFHLNWPDSENLLQTILSADLDTWPAFNTLELPIHDDHEPEGGSDSPWVQSTTGQHGSHTGNDAVLNLSRSITSVSANIASEAQSTGLTTTFLDDSLLMFWSKFVPAFPVVHQPTFIFKDWTYPLLLNAIALGSLFTGREDDRIKGEVLWRLAHTYVATSWHSLIKHKGPYDACSGIQLVLTALLGQTYAILSKNASIRMTAAIFHSLGFFWAQETGMYDLAHHDDFLTTGSGDLSQSDLDRWRKWAARETQLRALLGHYIIDGHISQYTGGPTCQKHTNNSLHPPASNRVFTSTTCEDWLMKMGTDQSHNLPLWKVFSFIFSPHTPRKHIGTFQSTLGASVVLEGIKSLIADVHVGPVAAVGSPSRKEITYALGRFYVQLNSSELLTAVEKMQMGLRWHAVIIDVATDFNRFCHNLCHNYQVRQTIFRGRREDPGFDLNSWACSVAGRRSLLSAIAIHNTLSSLPLGVTPTTHLAASIFMAAIVYCGMLLSGIRAVSVPQQPDYESVLMLHDDNDNFLDTLIEDEYLCFVRGVEFPQGELKNLWYDINLFSMSLKNIADVWGVAMEMHHVVHMLLSAVNSVEI